MSADQIVLLAVGLAVIAGVAVAVAWATAGARADANLLRPDRAAAVGLRDHEDTAADLARPGTARGDRPLISPTSTRQVARVVALLYLASAAVIVAITNAWPESEAAVFSLLAVGTLLVVLFMDLVPPSALGRWRRPAEGIGAIIFLALLTALTSGASSPFFVGFFLVVAGTALSTEGRAPLAIALLAAACVAIVGAIDALDAPLAPEALAWVGFTAVALILLADIATAAARAQRHARDEALRASRFDSLTGLYNRAFFFTTMEQEIRRSDRMGRDFTMLMLDLDDLKPVNDTFGHQWGDRLLKAVADTIRDTIRFTDAAARYGGDEFVVLLPETDAAGGYVVAEKLRRDVASLTLRAAERNVRSSVSVGLVTYPHDGSTIEQLVAAADVAMYESKRRGKNRIVGYQTRTERVATAIDIESAAVITVEPMATVRTGGDPVPWGIADQRGMTDPRGAADPLGAAESRSPSVPRADLPPTRAALTELGPAEPAATGLPTGSDETAGAAALDSHPGATAGPATVPTIAVVPEPGVPKPSAGRAPRQLSGTAPEPLPGSAPGPLPRMTPEPAADAAPGSAPTGQPWVTKTVQPMIDQPPATQERPAADGDSSNDVRPAADSRSSNDVRPAADSRSSGGRSSGRAIGRGEEIRGDQAGSARDRPWIALPIEPWEPPERPRG